MHWLSIFYKNHVLPSGGTHFQQNTDLQHFMKHTKLISTAIICLIGCTTGNDINYTDFVDPRIGTGGHGHVFVGANLPFGMVQLGPTSIPQQWDWCSGYHESDSTVIGFSHTHLSGTGIGDLFDITVMPVIDSLKADGTSSLTYARGSEDDPTSGLWSYAERSKEICRPGYYSVPLTRYGITAELTATCYTGYHRYTFPASENAAIVFDLKNGGCWDRPMETFIEAADPATGLAADSTTYAIRGYRHSRGWADNQRIYFYAEFSKPLESLDIIHEDVEIWENERVNMPTYAKAGFKTEEGEQVMLKVAISAVSMEGAYKNMDRYPDWGFDRVVEYSNNLWNSALSAIKIETENEDDTKIFYTALYHTMIAPSTFSDNDGSYRGADGKIYISEIRDKYTTFSLWDTYRAAMPLYSLINHSMYPDMINTMLTIYKEQGKLPVWHLHGCETNCMVGNPGIPPVADAIVKDIGWIDHEEAFEAMKASALRPDRGQDLRMKYGYIPCDLFKESVAYELEYALADGAIAHAAEKLAENATKEGDTQKAEYYHKEAEYFKQRSKSYKHLFDPETGFIRGKDSKGNFRKQYNPFASSHRADDYCEGNGWQYTWLVPHDVEGLIECFGSKEAFINKLDSLFIVPSEIAGEDASADISGLIGQYAHGNEPSHHIAYLYSMVNQPWKTAERVREILSTMYSSKPDGLCGNEDVGQMSAWYILSSLGFYQVEPGSDRYWFGSPLFDKAAVSVCYTSTGPFQFYITAKDNSAENKYIQSVTLNGKPYNKGYIAYKDIIGGGKLEFQMGPEPAIWY